MEKYNIEVGMRITELRRRRGYTREKLSELSDVSVQFLADIEKGRKSMTISTLRKISAALLSSTDYIVNGTPEQDENFAILSIINNIPEKNKKQAEVILAAFAEAVGQNKFI